MYAKKFIWLGFAVGSTVGGYVPTMWGDDMISFSGLFFSFIGGLVGIWGGYKLNEMIES